MKDIYNIYIKLQRSNENLMDASHILGLVHKILGLYHVMVSKVQRHTST